MINKAIIILVLLLLMTANIASYATPPQLRTIDKAVIDRAKELHYTNSPQDAANLNELLRLYEGSRGFDCSPECNVFEDAFLSYQNDLLLNNVLLTSDKKYNPNNLELNVEIIKKKKIYDVVPYLVDYLEENFKPIEDTIKTARLSGLLDILGDSGRKEGIPFLRERLLSEGSLDTEMTQSLDAHIRSRAIVNLGKLKDFESINAVLEFCKRNLLQKQINNDIFVNCLEAFKHYKNPEFIGFVIENYLDMDKLNFYVSKQVFPSFAMDKSVYSQFDGNTASWSVSNDVLIKKWQDWYKSNKDKIVWSEDLNKFIEKGTERDIKEYLIIEKSVKQTGFFQRIVNWFKHLFK